ncbi:hypothetical protein [Streptomyces sp. NPDC002853]
MMKHAQGHRHTRLNPFGPAPVSCNLMWDDRPMTDEERAREEAALKELDALTSAYKKADAAREKARDALHSAIVKHLMERNARPGQVADHSPYDRNHIRRIANEAGVPPLRERTVRSAKAGD